MIKKYLVTAVFVFNVTAGWATEKNLEVVGLTQISEVDLRSAVVEYYNAEKEKNWPRAYTYRRVAFQQTVSYRFYERSMAEGMQGWDLETITIEASWPGKYRFGGGALSVVYVDIIFAEKISEEYFIFGNIVKKTSTDLDIQRSTGTTAWIIEKEQWKCLDCGFRGHLALNFPIVRE